MTNKYCIRMLVICYTNVLRRNLRLMAASVAKGNGKNYVLYPPSSSYAHLGALYVLYNCLPR